MRLLAAPAPQHWKKHRQLIDEKTELRNLVILSLEMKSIFSFFREWGEGGELLSSVCLIASKQCCQIVALTIIVIRVHWEKINPSSLQYRFIEIEVCIYVYFFDKLNLGAILCVNSGGEALSFRAWQHGHSVKGSLAA
jgi:hypothetical protein